MADNALQLPNSQVAFVGKDGLLTVAGRSALENVIRNLRDQIAALESTDVTISEALAALIAIEDGTIIAGSALLLNGQPGSYYLDWANFTGTPTTLSGYGITDFTALADHADDAAAAIGGVAVGAFYRTGSIVKQRIV